MLSSTLLDEIRQRGVIRITAHWDDTSAQYLDPRTGEPAGVVGLVGNLLAQDLGVRAEFVELPWADHLEAIVEGRADISVKHTLTPQRALEVEFTLYHLLCEEGRIVIRRDSDVPTEANLNQPQRVMAVALGSSQEIHTRRRYPAAQLRIFPTAQDALNAVAVGEADACLHDTLVPGFLRLQPECTILTQENGEPVIPYRDCVHPCIKPGDPHFLNWLNSWMAFHRSAGTFEMIIAEAEAAHNVALAFV